MSTSASRRVLVVDDTPGARDVIVQMVRANGYEVVAAIDGETAIERAAEQDFALLISDLEMPGMNGMELIGRVRRDHPGVKAILLTGRYSETLEVEALRAGVEAVFFKPVSWSEIIPKIRELVP